MGTHHHFIVDFPRRGHVLHSHGHAASGVVKVARRPSMIRCSGSSNDNNNNNNSRRRDDAQPKNHRRLSSSSLPSPPVAFAPPLRFFQLLPHLLRRRSRCLLLVDGASSPFLCTSLGCYTDDVVVVVTSRHVTGPHRTARSSLTTGDTTERTRQENHTL